MVSGCGVGLISLDRIIQTAYPGLFIGDIKAPFSCKLDASQYMAY